MKRWAVAGVVCGMVLGGVVPAGAQNWPGGRTRDKREAVAACIVIVRKETDERLGFKVSDFDAYLKPDGIVVWFGTPKERFSFAKCMNEKGYPISEESPWGR